VPARGANPTHAIPSPVSRCASTSAPDVGEDEDIGVFVAGRVDPLPATSIICSALTIAPGGPPPTRSSVTWARQTSAGRLATTPRGPSTLEARDRRDPVGGLRHVASGATEAGRPPTARLPRGASAASTQRLPATTDARSSARSGDLVFAPVIRLHGGDRGGLVAERSAGFVQWVHGAVAYTRRNLLSRPFVGREEHANLLIRLGSLYSTELRSDPPPGELPPVPPARLGDSRSELQRFNDSATYEKIVALANSATAFGLSVDNVRAMATQAAHLTESDGHSLVATVWSAMHNSWQQKAISAAHSGRKKTVTCYRVAVVAFWAWAAQKFGHEAVVLPVSRTTVVNFLEFERVRRVLPRKRQRDEDDDVDYGDDDSGEDGENDQGGGDAVGQEGDGVFLAGSCTGRARGAEPDGGGESIGRGGQPGLAAKIPTGASARGTASASGGAVGGGQITPASGGPRRGQHVGVDAAAPPRPARGRQVGPQVLLNAVNALAKIGNTLNLLWRDAKCSCCERWRRDDYSSAGSYAPARAVFNQHKRERVLEDHAAGFPKAVRRRDPSVTEEQREEVSRRLLLTPTSPAAYQLKSVLAGLFAFTFSLHARGGTARGVAWSYLAVRQFPAMFSEVGGPIDVLCTYITASKTSEGIVHNIGALGHANAWLCPVGAMADAMVATFHAPGMDESRPPQAFQPSFQPTDAELRASGVDPTRYWAADQPYGFRAWYRVPLWPSARGHIFAQINAAYHQKKQREVLLQ